MRGEDKTLIGIICCCRGKRVSKVDLREKRSECMELLTQVDAASQIGEQRAQMARENSSNLDILSKILNTTSGRDTTVDKLTEVIADVQMGRQSGKDLKPDSGAEDADRRGGQHVGACVRAVQPT